MRIRPEGSKTLKVCFMGGRQAGMTALLTIMASGCEVCAAVVYDESVKLLPRLYTIPCYGSIKDAGFIEALKSSDMLVCVHGREYVGPSALSLPRFGGVNLHPYL